MDKRIEKLAHILVHHSIKVKKGETILIRSQGLDAKELVIEVARLITRAGAHPRVDVSVPGLGYTFLKNATKKQLEKKPDIALYEAKKIDGFISIGAEYNTKELTNIDPEKIAMRRKATKEISEIILKKDRWVGCEFPTDALAQDAEMALSEFEDFVYGAVLQDYKKLEKREEKLKKLLDKTSKVKIIGKDTHLEFSIKGRTSIKCFGRHNIPDGEVFIAPVDNSAEGYISYSFPAIYGGREVDGVKLWFKKGEVVKATATKNEAFLKKMIATDPGAKRFGEFGVGVNYGIKKNIKQILFDEKMGGTIHLALGMAYKKGGGKNESAIHWDMIKDLRKGGELYFDDKLVQRNGKFTFKY